MFLPSLLAFLALVSLVGPLGLGPCWLYWHWMWQRRHWDQPHFYGKKRPAPSVAPPSNARKPDWVRRFTLYMAVFGKSCREIEALFNRRHGATITIGKTWVAEFVKAHAQEIADRRRAMRRRLPWPFAIGHTWAMDLTFLVNEQGLSFAMLGILDHGSRRVLCLKQLPRKCTLALLGHLLLAMSRCGIPAAIQTDNESMFTSALWRMTLASLRIRHRRSALGCPWQNGRIERLFGTLKPLLRDIKPRTAKALRITLKEFAWFYNHVRVHQNLKGLTPMEAWHGKTLAEVQHAQAARPGRWVQALGGRLSGYHLRC